MSSRSRALRSLAAAGAAAISLSCSAQAPSLTQPSQGAQDSVGERLKVPAGFTVKYYAKGLVGVRFLAVGPDGAVYASIPSKGVVVRLTDGKGNGVADKLVVAVNGQDRPHGIAFHKGWLYIANTSSVVRVHLKADGTADGTPETLATFTGDGMHWTRSIAFGADGAMYLAMGSDCNVCVESDSMRAAVTRFGDDGTHGKRFAFGLRNAVGIALDPATSEIWVSQNERDNITPDHENLPPDELNILRAGGDFGWPYCYSQNGRAVPNPEFPDASRCAGTIPAALDLQAHSAPLGISFLANASKFPAEYRGDLLIAFHGSWDRSVPTGAKVVRVHIANNKPVSYDDFVSGWQLPNGQRWGRPVDVAVAADGSVLISDDMSGSIYRVSR